MKLQDIQISLTLINSRLRQIKISYKNFCLLGLKNLQNDNHMVSCEQWNNFYTNFWSDYSKKIEFMTNYDNLVQLEKE